MPGTLAAHKHLLLLTAILVALVTQPFVASESGGPSEPWEVLANVVLFVPFGCYLRLLAPAWSWWSAAGVFAASSLSLEAAQYVLAVGSSDLTDVIVNTAGGLAGFGLLPVMRRRLRPRTVVVMIRACAAGTVILLVTSAVVAASPMHSASPDRGAGPKGTMPVRESSVQSSDPTPQAER